MVPSEEYPSPGDGKYYTGGYITRTYGSLEGGQVDAIQIESPRILRGGDAKMDAYVKALAKVVVRFYEENYKPGSSFNTFNTATVRAPQNSNYTGQAFGIHCGTVGVFALWQVAFLISLLACGITG